jgi:hypothetical protein
MASSSGADRGSGERDEEEMDRSFGELEDVGDMLMRDESWRTVADAIDCGDSSEEDDVEDDNVEDENEGDREEEDEEAEVEEIDGAAGVGQRKKRKLTAAVWQTAAKKVDNKGQCNICQMLILCRGGNTSNITNHVKNRHPRSEECKKMVALEKQQADDRKRKKKAKPMSS